MSLARRWTIVRALLALSLASATLVAVTGALDVSRAPRAEAGPAPTPTSPGTITATGTYAGGTIPDGVCYLDATVTGGSGGSAIATPNANGAGGMVGARIPVVPGQTFSGTVGGGGQESATPGAPGGGTAGTGSGHRGSGGGGYTELIVGGQTVLLGGGGGGSGGGHANNGGFGGDAGHSSATGVTAGSDGLDGFTRNGAGGGGVQDVGAGKGGGTGAAGAGGTQPVSARNGFAGSGRTGGDGGIDNGLDTGGGGGGGWFGGGGGASTDVDGGGNAVAGGNSGGGGGGGSSYIHAAGAGAGNVSNLTSGTNTKLASTGNGANGRMTLTYVPCQYDITATKSATPNPAAPGETVTYTVTLTNQGPDPMTRGDSLTFTDVLTPASARTITGVTFTGTGGVQRTLANTTATCTPTTGGTVPTSPAQVSCTRPFSSTAPGAATTGSRGLNVGESMTMTYTITPLTVGTRTNTVTVDDRCTAPSCTDAGDTATASVPVNETATLSLDKTVSPTTFTAVGQTLTYTFDVENTGNVPLTNFQINDPMSGLSAITCAPVATGSTLAVGGTTTCTATRTTTQADLDGLVPLNNTATVTGTSPTNQTATATDTATSTPRVARFTFDKQAGALTDAAAPTGPSAGDTITYTFVITNTGNETLDPVTLSDPTVGPITCSSGPLAGGAVRTCTKVYTLTQADVNAGTVNNTATVAATAPAGVPQPPPVTDQTSTPVTAGPALTLDKSHPVTAPGSLAVGSTITYSFLVTNTGNVTLDPITISDPKVGAVSCPTGPLDPAGTRTCTATYTVTQADVDAGTVNNTATASGTPPTGPAVSAVDTDNQAITRTSSLTLDKQAGAITEAAAPAGPSAGDTITYTFVVQNTGNVTLNPVTVTDPKVGTVTCPTGDLAPGATRTCTAAPYVLTQTDVNAGTVDNTATANGTPPAGVTAPTAATDSTSTPVAGAPSITIEKSHPVTDPATIEVDDTITYSFLVTNTGTVSLNPVTVTDPKTGPVTCATGVLAPGGTRTCTATYTVTQADVDAGEIVNTASVSGTPPATASNPNPTPVTDDDTDTQDITRTAELDLDKQAGTINDLDTNGPDVGDTIVYTFVVENTGNVTLDPVTVADPKVGAVTCPAGPLAPGDTTTCTAAPYALTQADVDSGAVNNTATADGTPPTGVTPPTPATDDTSTVIAAGPAVTLDKSHPVTDPATIEVGDTITYSFLVTNTGNVTLDPVSINDPKVGTVSCPAGALAPTATKTCTATYTVLQADVDAGTIVNNATVSGTPPATSTNPNPTPVTSTDQDTQAITRDAELAIDKQAGALTDTDANGPDAGDTITYTFVVENTGNVTLDTIAVTDPKVGTVTCPAGPLAPGATRTCTAAPYVLTQTDVNSGTVDNTATVNASAPPGATAPDPATDNTSTPVTRTASLSLDKQAGALTDVDANGPDAGDTITYTFVVQNTGNVSLDPITVNDPKVGAVTCPAGAVAPGDSVTCTAAPYVLTQTDVDSGSVDNTASAGGVPPAGVAAPAPSTDNTSSPIAAGPAITIDKSHPVTDPATVAVGDTISYSFLVTNTGNVTLNQIAIYDPKAGAVTCPVTTLAPQGTTTCTAEYTVLQADVDAGTIVNTATVSGTPPATATTPNPAPVTATDTDTQPITRVATLTLDKQAGAVTEVSAPAGPSAGDTITYTFVVTNTGNVTLDPVTVTDPKVGTVTCPAGALAPQSSVTCTAPAYVLLQSDVNAGTVNNTATANGTPPAGATPPAPAVDSTVTPIPENPQLVLDKSVGVPVDENGTNRTDPGDTVVFTFAVSNTGNVPIGNLQITDAMLAAANVTITCVPTTIEPGELSTCTSSPYTITPADADAGAVNNTATAGGVSGPNGTAVTSNADTTSTPLEQVARLDLVKTSELNDDDGDGNGDEGEVITYTFTVTNSGTVTMNDVEIVDSMLSDAGIAPVCPKTTLTSGESMECTADYTIQAGDGDGSQLVNVATAIGSSVLGAFESEPSEAVVPVVPPKVNLPVVGGVDVRILVGAALMILIGATALVLGRRRRVEGLD